MKKGMLLVLSLVWVAACTATLPQKVEVAKSYSLAGVRSYTLKTVCDKVNLDPSLNKAFVGNYCQILDGSVKMALQKTNPEFQNIGANGDISIEVALEDLHGGSAAARFWIGFGAGRSVSTAYVKVFKGQEVLAEGRITETTTMPNVVAGTYSNEDALIQDAPLLARQIAEFVNDPRKAKQ